MFLGRDLPGKETRVRVVREWVRARSPWALAAGGLGVIAPVDAVFILPGLASIVLGFVGLRDLRNRPHLLGRRLCVLGIIGGVLGLTAAGFLYTWDGPERVESRSSQVESG